jgi:hypothetical protein
MCLSLSGVSSFHTLLYLPLLVLPLAAICIVGIYRIVPVVFSSLSTAKLLYGETWSRQLAKRPVQIAIFLSFLTLAVYCFTIEIAEMLERRKDTRERERMIQQEELINAALNAGTGCEFCRNSRVSRNRMLQQQMASGARWL